MFTRRSETAETTPTAPVLQALLERRQEQATTFRGNDDKLQSLDLPNLTEYLSPPDILQNKNERPIGDLASNNENSEARGSPWPAISLLDTLPFFMAISAAQNSMQQSTITDKWMRLAAGYMAQAVAEQYIVYRSQRQEVLQEAFAWGFDSECGAEEGTDEWQINAMFWGEDEVVDGWEQIRDEQMQVVGLQDKRVVS